MLHQFCATNFIYQLSRPLFEKKKKPFLQYRISNINYNITSGSRYPMPDKSAPVYITVGDGGNQEGLAVRYLEDVDQKYDQ